MPSALLTIYSLQTSHEPIDNDFADWGFGEALGPDKFDLLSPECPEDCDDTASTCSFTSSEGSGRHPLESLSAATVPQFDDVLHIHNLVNPVPDKLQHLYRLSSTIRKIDIELIHYYARLLLSSEVAPRAKENNSDNDVGILFAQKFHMRYEQILAKTLNLPSVL